MGGNLGALYFLRASRCMFFIRFGEKLCSTPELSTPAERAASLSMYFMKGEVPMHGDNGYRGVNTLRRIGYGVRAMSISGGFRRGEFQYREYATFPISAFYTYSRDFFLF